MRQSNLYEDWITRCEETIQAFLAAANVEIETVEGGLYGPWLYLETSKN